jgi:hypothetical protein
MRVSRLPIGLFLSATLFSTLSNAGDGVLREKCNTDLAVEGKVCVPLQSAVRRLHAGVAIVYSPENGGVGTIVKDATTNVVRVTKENAAAARAAFELHYFFEPPKGLPERDSWGWGPFVSLNTRPVDNLDDGNIFSSVGAGLMIGAVANDAGTSSVNFGLGFLVDTDVKRLAAGVQDGKPTTLNDNQLLKSTTSTDFMAILSYKMDF